MKVNFAVIIGEMRVSYLLLVAFLALADTATAQNVSGLLDPAKMYDCSAWPGAPRIYVEV